MIINSEDIRKLKDLQEHLLLVKKNITKMREETSNEGMLDLLVTLDQSISMAGLQVNYQLKYANI